MLTQIVSLMLKISSTLSKFYEKLHILAAAVLAANLKIGMVLANVLFGAEYKTRPNKRPYGDFFLKQISDPPKLPTLWGFCHKNNKRPDQNYCNPVRILLEKK